MGAFDEAQNILLPDDDADPEAAIAFRKKWSWDAHEQVILRGEYTAADHEAVQNVTSPRMNTQQAKKGNQEVSANVGTGHLKLLERMIVDWTFTHSGRKVEVSTKVIRRLKSNYMTPILSKIDEISVGISEEDQEDFLDSANEPTKENSLTTK